MKRNWFLRHKWWTLFFVALIVMIVAMFVTAKKVEKKNFVTMDITRGLSREWLFFLHPLRPQTHMFV